MPVSSDEWEGKEETKSAVPHKSKRNSLGLNWERDVGVGTGLWGTEHRVHRLGGNLEVSGGTWGSQSDSGDHFCVV